MNCGNPSKWRLKEFCKQPACDVCRYRYIRRQTKQATERFAASANSEMSLVTIVAGASADIQDVGPIFKLLQKKLRNLVEYNRRRSGGWNCVEVLAYLETDVIDASQVSMILSERRQLLEEIGLPATTSPSAPIWIVTAHAVVRHNKIGRQTLQEALKRAWPASRQVDVRPVHETKPLDENLSAIIDYSNKHEPTTHLMGNLHSAWEPDWVRSYYEYLHSWSRGFQKLRFTISPKGSRGNIHNQDEGEEGESSKLGESRHIEPMPFVFLAPRFSHKATLSILGMPWLRELHSTKLSQGP